MGTVAPAAAVNTGSSVREGTPTEGRLGKANVWKFGTGMFGGMRPCPPAVTELKFAVTVKDWLIVKDAGFAVLVIPPLKPENR
jgi:hypothetical protein